MVRKYFKYFVDYKYLIFKKLYVSYNFFGGISNSIKLIEGFI